MEWTVHRLVRATPMTWAWHSSGASCQLARNLRPPACLPSGKKTRRSSEIVGALRLSVFFGLSSQYRSDRDSVLCSAPIYRWSVCPKGVRPTVRSLNSVLQDEARRRKGGYPKPATTGRNGVAYM